MKLKKGYKHKKGEIKKQDVSSFLSIWLLETGKQLAMFHDAEVPLPLKADSIYIYIYIYTTIMNNLL